MRRRFQDLRGVLRVRGGFEAIDATLMKRQALLLSRSK